MAVAMAALAALFMGSASAAQHHATHQVDHRPALHPALVVALLRRPWWLLGSLASIVGLVLQTTALAIGSIIVVQTIMISSLGWTAVGESLFARKRPNRRVVAGVGLAVFGVVGFLAQLQPHLPPDPPAPSFPAVCIVLTGCATLAAAGGLLATRGAGQARALGLALATGVGYGLTAALLKLVTTQIRHGGWPAPLHHPALYAAAALGPAAVLLSQNTLQQGQLASPALTIILLLDPVVGVATGVLWFCEQLATSPGAVAGAAACIATSVAGVAVSQTTTGPGRTSEWPRQEDVPGFRGASVAARDR